MSSLKGYNTLGCKVLNKEGQPLDPDYLKRYCCVLCHYVLRQALQIECGDRICKGCLPTTLFHCSLCGEEIDPTKPNQFFNDRSCQKDVQNFFVLCKCEEKFKIEEWERHSESCEEIQKIKPKSTASTASPEIVSHLESELKQTRAEVTDQKKQVAKCLKKIEAFEKEVRQLRLLVDEVRRGVATYGIPGNGSRNTGDGEAPMNPRVLDQIRETVTQLVSDVEQQKGTLRQLNTSVEHFTQTFPRMETILEELNLKIEILEVKSTSGVYIWKVNDLTRRAREARIGRTVSLYSPPFYTSPHGYRLCLRAYLFGDGSGKGTHISLFIVVMKSEYDDLLAWPFQHKVTLTLINQNFPLVPERSLTHRFVPNSESSSFKKPVETFNVASGFPEFAELNVLEDQAFCKSDTLYFRIKLDPPGPVTGPDELRD